MHSNIKPFIESVRAFIFPEYFEAGGVRSALERMVEDSVADAFIRRLPEIARLVRTDVEAVMQNDPAAASEEEIILCYPAINVMIHYRSAHELYLLGVPTIPRMITEKAHSENGIDIHPAATIGEYFAIDHGTGIVVGATCRIGSRRQRLAYSQRGPTLEGPPGQDCLPGALRGRSRNITTLGYDN